MGAKGDLAARRETVTEVILSYLQRRGAP